VFISPRKSNLPTGATIVVTFGGVLIIMFLIHLILHHGREARQLEGAASAQRENLDSHARIRSLVGFLRCYFAGCAGRRQNPFNRK